MTYAIIYAEKGRYNRPIEISLFLESRDSITDLSEVLEEQIKWYKQLGYEEDDIYKNYDDNGNLIYISTGCGEEYNGNSYQIIEIEGE